MPIRDHVDAFDRRNLLDILQALERLDRREYGDVLVGPWRVFGGVTRSVAPVSGVRPLARDAPVAERRILSQAEAAALLRVAFLFRRLAALNPLLPGASESLG